MKFLTRAIYNAMQGDPDRPEVESADAKWEANGLAYQAHLESIKPQLTKSMQEFCDTSLHDGVIESYGQPRSDVVELQIDARENPWGPVGFYRLVFTGVQWHTILENLVNEWWLYQEVHLHDEAGFEYRVLLTEGEFCVVADNVELQKIDI
jgi:hypothetical protein